MFSRSGNWETIADLTRLRAAGLGGGGLWGGTLPVRDPPEDILDRATSFSILTFDDEATVSVPASTRLANPTKFDDSPPTSKLRRDGDKFAECRDGSFLLQKKQETKSGNFQLDFHFF